MAGILVVLFIAIPIAELAVIGAVAERIGIWQTLLLVAVFSIGGAVLAKREGLVVWARFRAATKRGEVPSAEVVDGFLVLLGGALLLTPGFVTDAVGLILVFPVTRALTKTGARRLIRRYVRRQFPPAERRPVPVTAVRVDDDRHESGDGRAGDGRERRGRRGDGGNGASPHG
ncbi:MAG: FxsA family protein [Actinomycetota bacterium]